MHIDAAWHAEGLRWIGSLFMTAADFLERDAPAQPAAAEPQHAFADSPEEVRSRMHLRGLV